MSGEEYFYHQFGPDYIISSERRKSWRPFDAVKLNHVENEDACVAPISVVTYLHRTVQCFPNHTALGVKRDGKWVKWTYSDYWRDIRLAAKGFIKLGLEPFHAVGILGFNAPEWFITHFAAIFSGGLAAGIYTTNSPDACFQILLDSKANIIVVENEKQLEKVINVREKLPNLKAIVQYIGKPKIKGVLSWEELLNLGRTCADNELEKRIKGLAINQCCCLVYTSGTTGKPKGVMLSHDNVITFIKFIVLRLFPMRFGKEKYVSYLPLSHVAAMASDIYGPIGVGSSVYFANPDALKGGLVNTLTEIEPTVLTGVPRVWEKISEKVKESLVEMSPTKKNLIQWAQKQAKSYHVRRVTSSNVRPDLGYLTAKLILSKVKNRLGLNKNHCLVTGGAPLSPELVQFFMSLDLILYETYGLSESAGPVTGNTKFAGKYKIGSVGQYVDVVNVSIENPDERGHGEIALKGRCNFMGYLNNEKETHEALDNNGWFRTGDIGYVDKDKFLFITGRKKELIITSGGENIPPVPIEDAVKEILPVVSNCMLIGEDKNFLTMIITLKTEINLDTMLPTDNLVPVALKWCLDKGCEAKTLSEILAAGPDEKVLQGIQEGIDIYNNNIAISNAQRIQKWVILPQDFSLPGDELGPTMKLKRPIVLQKYREYVDDLYRKR